MFSISHLIIVFVVALVVFGPEKLPELARNVGKLMGEFRKATGDLRSTFEGHLKDLEREADLRRPTTALPANTIASPSTVVASPSNSVALPATAVTAADSAYNASPAAAEAEVSSALGAAGTVPTIPPHLNIGKPAPEDALPASVAPAESASEVPLQTAAEAVPNPPELQPEHHPESLTDAGIHPA